MNYAYKRISTDRQDSRRQHQVCEQLAESEGQRIQYWLEDTLTGSIPWQERALGDWLTSAAEGDTIYIPEISRIARSMTGILTFMEACQKKNICISCASPRIKLDDSMQSKAVAFAFGLVAEMERTLLRERTRTALAERKSRGVILGRPRGKTGNSKLDKHREAVTKMLQAKCSLSSIGRAFNCTRQTVARWAAENIEGDVITSDANAGRTGI